MVDWSSGMIVSTFPRPINDSRISWLTTNSSLRVDPELACERPRVRVADRPMFLLFLPFHIILDELVTVFVKKRAW